MRYYLAQNGQRIGPLTEDELAARGIAPEALIWREGLPNWTQAVRVPELSHWFSGVPAQPQPGQQPQPVQPVVQQPQYSQQPQYVQQYAQQPQPVQQLQQYPAAQQYQPMSYAASPALYDAASRPSGLAIASMVLGIVSLVCMLGVHVGAIISIPSGIVAVVLGSIARSRARTGASGGMGMATAGIVCGSISLGLYALLIAMALTCMSSVLL